MDFLQFMFDGFWVLVSKVSNWQPDELLKSQIEFTAAAFGIIGGAFGIFKLCGILSLAV